MELSRIQWWYLPWLKYSEIDFKRLCESLDLSKQQDWHGSKIMIYFTHWSFLPSSHAKTKNDSFAYFATKCAYCWNIYRSKDAIFDGTQPRRKWNVICHYMRRCQVSNCDCICCFIRFRWMPLLQLPGR